ncbi:MAG: asparagine synthase-related protein, partial [Stackebrandtia sp.]
TGRLNGREVARLLAQSRRYSADTMLADVHQLTACASAVATPVNGLAVSYPSAVAHSRARELAADADPVAAVAELLAQAVDARPMGSAATAVELSGGMDSANVALTLAEREVVPAVASAMIMPGDAGRQQAERRAEFIARTGYARDTTIDAAEHPPLCPSGDRAQGAPVSPYAEPFSEATAALLARVAAAGVRTVYTGIGGDEMLAAQPGERDTEPHPPTPPTWAGPATLEALSDVDTNTAPATAISEPTLLAFACRAPLFLAEGLWPVSPLADPALITFAEWLPRPWRADKYLFRERLRRAGLSHDFVRPKLREHFTPLMDAGLRCHGVTLLRQMLTDGTVLAEAGYVDPDALLVECDRIDAGNSDLDRTLYEGIAVELATRAAMT